MVIKASSGLAVRFESADLQQAAHAAAIQLD
jgi:hypothetical protein